MEKINKKRIFFDHIPVVGLFVFAILFIVSCIDESIKPDNNETKDKAEYKLYIAGKELIGDGVDSSWDPSLGIIWLGTDENNLPTGTLTILIDTIITVNGIKQAFIASATLSTVDALVGTAQQINGKTYRTMSRDEMEVELGAETGIQWIDSVVVGANYISGSIDRWEEDPYSDGEVWTKEGWYMKETTTGEMHYLEGTFTAISNN
jgi:hypothetical protein